MLMQDVDTSRDTRSEAVVQAFRDGTLSLVGVTLAYLASIPFAIKRYRGLSHASL